MEGFFKEIDSSMLQTNQRLLYQPQQVVKRLPGAWRWSLSVWIFYRLALSAWAVLIWKMGLIQYEIGSKYYLDVNPIISGWKGALLGVWQRWDAIYYMQIAQNGYTTNEASAFFPLYPLLGRALSFLTSHQILLALLIVSNLAFLFTLVLLYQLVEAEFSTTVAKRALIFLSVFPTSFFFFAPYPQSLSLLLVLAAYIAARQSKWLLATLAGFCAGLTHSTVLPLVLILGFEALKYIKQNNSASRWIALLPSFGPALGTILYFAWRISTRLPAISEIQKEYWGRIIQMPWQTFSDIASMIRAHNLPVTSWINLFILFIVLFITFWELKYLSLSLNIYQISSVAYLLFFTTIDEPIASLGRFCLIMFPLFIGLSLWAHSPRRRLISVSIGIFSQLLLSGIFVMWGFVS
jgi:hypothetical protein